MKKIILVTLSVLMMTTRSTGQTTLLQPSDFTLDGFRDVRFDGLTAYMRGLTHRYVNGELRFMSLTHTGELREFVLTGVSLGGTITTITRRWTGVPGTKDLSGIWFNAATNRLWVTSSVDYTTETIPAHITMMTLNDNGTISNVKTVNLSGVNEKRMYGGCQPSPLPAYQYICGWGGYTSLVNQGGGAPMGPSMVGIGDPDAASNGATIPATKILDTDDANRGLRATIPLNYFDGGDADGNGVRRENPQTPPTLLPYSGAGWLSPNAQGKGWFVWGDSYYNNGVYIQTATKRGYVAIAALCGVTGQTTTTVGNSSASADGKCWYMTSTLNFDGRTQELHIWDIARLGSGLLTRPDSMTELAWPRGIVGSWAGDVPMANISGVTYDSVSGRLYAICFPCGAPSNGPNGEWDTGRLYQVAVNSSGSPVPPVSIPTVSITAPAANATVSGASVSVTASASDSVGVSGVQFKLDGANLGSEDVSAPYAVTWDTTAASNGAHVVTAVARNAANNTATASPISVTVNNATADVTPPVVTVTAPAANATVSGAVTLTATATDDTAVASVQFLIDGMHFATPDTSAPYTTSWTSTAAAKGSHTIQAVAIDTAGNTALSSVRTITVDNSTTTPPPPPGPVTPCASPRVSLTVSRWPIYAGRNTGTWSASGTVGAFTVTFSITSTVRTATITDSRGCSVTLQKF